MHLQAAGFPGCAHIQPQTFCDLKFPLNGWMVGQIVH